MAHEIGHGIDHFSSGLEYERESGAIDEALGDIWGALVEKEAKGANSNNWIVGEDITSNGNGIRSLINPKNHSDPDTYGGTNWLDPNCATPNDANDQCGVHTNSGVMNHWFYLLSEGSAATDEINDNFDTFNIDGIGTDKAAKIIYRAQQMYFISTETFLMARNHTISAAEDLYGVNSLEAITVNNAWYAVGIGNEIGTSITGEDAICNPSSETYTVENATVTWQVSSNLQILNSTSSTITVKPKVSYYTNGWIKATFSPSFSITKNIQLNNTPLNSNDFIVTDQYYSSVSGSGTYSDPFLVCPNSSYILGYSGTSSVDLSTMNNVTLPYGWSGYSYGVLELSFTTGSFYGSSEMIDIDYQGECGNSLHSVYFQEDLYNCYGGYYMFSIVPNPITSNKLEILKKESSKMILESNTDVGFLLYNDKGILLKSKKDKNNKNSYKVNVSNLNKGIYFIKVITEKHTEVHRVLVDR